jgi:hypothetical protein
MQEVKVNINSNLFTEEMRNSYLVRWDMFNAINNIDIPGFLGKNEVEKLTEDWNKFKTDLEKQDFIKELLSEDNNVPFIVVRTFLKEQNLNVNSNLFTVEMKNDYEKRWNEFKKNGIINF